MNFSDALAGAVRQVPEGSEIAVFCLPGAARSAVVGLHAGQLKVKVQAPLVAGKANDALAELLAGLLGVARRQVALVSGEQSRRKRMLVRGLDPAALTAVLREHLSSGQLEFLAPGGSAGG